MSFEGARAIADTVLYEGYILYPYRASAPKNVTRARFQFGVVTPRAWAQVACEPWRQVTECLVTGAAHVDVRLRFLQLEARRVLTPDGQPVAALEVDGRRLVTWDEGVEREADVVAVALRNAEVRVVDVLLEGGAHRTAVLDAGGAVGARVHTERWPLRGRITVSVEEDDDVHRVRVLFENLAARTDLGTRDEALRYAFLGAHTMLHAPGGRFVSMLEPPPDMSERVSRCQNVNTWPVLVGDDTMLSSPIILYDQPQVAPESRTPYHDATEIDELLTLRVMTLTEEEKREAAATDARAKRIVEASDSIPREMLEKLHGAVRTVRPVEIRVGARVRLRPRAHADVHDLFLAGRMARVEDVMLDVDDTAQFAVTLEDDPGADICRETRRFRYFRYDELELVTERGGHGPCVE